MVEHIARLVVGSTALTNRSTAPTAVRTVQMLLAANIVRQMPLVVYTVLM